MKKFLVILSFAMLVGCSMHGPYQAEEKQEPRFRFGDKVYVANGFYRGSKGRVTKCYYINSETGIVCEIDAFLISVDGKFTKTQQMKFHQTDLVEDASGE